MRGHWSHDIRDPDAFVGRIVSRHGGTLDHGQRERLHQYLLIALWELSQIYEANGRKANFSGYAGQLLPRRVTDWRRSAEEGGRTRWQFRDSVYERPLPVMVSLDGELGRALTERGVDGPVPGATDFVRALRERSGVAAREADEVGEGSFGEAA